MNAHEALCLLAQIRAAMTSLQRERFHQARSDFQFQHFLRQATGAVRVTLRATRKASDAR